MLKICKTALNFANDNKKLISAVGSIAGAPSQISRANESAKQLEAINKIKHLREAKTVTQATKANPEMIQKISNNFSGRGMKKKTGGLLKAF